MIDSLASFLDYWPKARARTTRVLDHLPASDLEWTWQPGRFTFGDLLRHLAGIERFMYAENVAGRPSRYAGHGIDLAAGLDGVRAYVERCHHEAMAMFGSLHDTRLHERCTTPAGATMPIWKWLRAMVEHEAHHRGQLYMMASMRGLRIPPLYGLTEEELRARSVADGPPGS